MSVLDKLASALGCRDEVPNRELAQQLAKAEDREAIAEIAANLKSKDKGIPADCVKVLYEIGYLKPELVAPYAADYLDLLKHRNNRMVWGGMVALATVAQIVADELYPHVEFIQRTMDVGSVITRGSGVWALSEIASANPEYAAAIFPYLLKHLRTCRPKDVPQHSERVVVAVSAENKDEFLQVIEKRMEDMSPTQLKRLKRVIEQAEEKES